jgi:methionyl-tRNA formyltransferase
MIFPEDTSGSLYTKMAQIGADLLIDTLDILKKGKLAPIRQNDAQASYAPPITKEEAKINWNRSAVEINNLIRGMNPWPIAHTVLENGKKLKIYKAEVLDSKSDCSVKTKKDPTVIRCGEGSILRVLEVQMEGKKRMSAEDFARGAQIKVLL